MNLINKISEKKSFKLFALYICNVILMLPCLIFGGSNFSIDSYGILAGGADVHISAFLGSFRYFGAFVYKILSLLNHNPIINSTIDIVFYVALVPTVVSFVVKEFSKCLNLTDPVSIIAVDSAVLISVYNVWFCDILSFPECIVITAVGIVFCFSSLLILINAKKVWQYFLSAILLVLSTAVYQQFISVFAIFAIAYCGAYTVKIRDKKLIVINYFKYATVILVSGIIYFISGKFFISCFGVKENERIALNISAIIENIKYFVSHQHSFLKGRGFFDTEILTVCFLIAGLVWFIVMFADWLKNKDTFKTFIIALSYVAAYFSAYLSGILSTSHATRTMFPLFSVFLLFLIGSLSIKPRKETKIILTVILLVVLSLNVYKIVSYESGLKKQNRSDEQWVNQVVDYINEHEEKTGQTVEIIYYGYDENYDMNIEKSFTDSATSVKYAFKSIFDVYSDSSYDFVILSEDESRIIFGENDWKEFDASKQLIFKDKELYLCCY